MLTKIETNNKRKHLDRVECKITYDDLKLSTEGCLKLIRSLEPDQLLQKLGLPLSIKDMNKEINDID
jgi:hypothetical protein